MFDSHGIIGWIAAVSMFLDHHPMSLADVINGVFECSGGLFIYLSVRSLYRAKIVRGVHWMPVAFFSTWGYWNLFFYPHLDQWLSFFGGIFLVAMNTFWLGQIAYYLTKEKIAHVHI